MSFIGILFDRETKGSACYMEIKMVHHFVGGGGLYSSPTVVSVLWCGDGFKEF